VKLGVVPVFNHAFQVREQVSNLLSKLLVSGFALHLQSTVKASSLVLVRDLPVDLLCSWSGIVSTSSNLLAEAIAIFKRVYTKIAWLGWTRTRITEVVRKTWC
jgi:hypothetical protein